MTTFDNKKMKLYDLKDLANELNISERTARRYVDDLISDTQIIRDNKYKFSINIFNAIVNSKQINDNDLTDNDNVITEYFTEDEYQEFQKRLTEYPLIKEQLEYVKELMEKNRQDYQTQLALMKTIINSIEQRNFIEAKEKGLDQ